MYPWPTKFIRPDVRKLVHDYNQTLNSVHFKKYLKYVYAQIFIPWTPCTWMLREVISIIIYNMKKTGLNYHCNSHNSHKKCFKLWISSCQSVEYITTYDKLETQKLKNELKIYSVFFRRVCLFFKCLDVVFSIRLLTLVVIFRKTE